MSLTINALKPQYKKKPGNNTTKRQNNDLEFKPVYFTFQKYVILGDRIATEFLYKNLDNTNISKCAKISDLLCNKTDTTEELVENIAKLPRNISKVIVIMGHDEHQAEGFHNEKFIKNLENIVKKLKSFRMDSIIVSKLIPKNTSMEDLQYWKSINSINAKIHELCNTQNIQFANLDQVVLDFDKTKNYNTGSFYFGKDGKMRFRVMKSRFTEEGNLSDQAYKTMAKKLTWIITELEKGTKVNTIKEIEDSGTDEKDESGGDKDKEKAKPTVNTVEFQVDIPEMFRTRPIISSVSTECGYEEYEGDSSLDYKQEQVAVKIHNYLLAIYVLFEINDYVLPAVVDSGSPYTFISEEIYEKITKNANPKEIREIAAANITVNGVLGKRPAKVTKNCYSILRFIDPSLQRIPIWTTVRVIKGFNTPIILGREFMEVYSATLGFGGHKGLKFDKPGNEARVKLNTYNYRDILELVKKGDLEDPHNFLKNVRVSMISQVNAITAFEERVEMEKARIEELWKQRVENTTAEFRQAEAIIIDQERDKIYDIQEDGSLMVDLVTKKDNMPIDPGKYENKISDLEYPPIMEDIVKEHSSVCSGSRGYSRQYIHHFVTKPEYHPSLCKFYDLPLKVKAEARIIIKNWLEDGTIRHSNSPYRNPLVAVKKADGTIRLCGDYRMLNRYLIARGDQAPNIEHLKARFGGATKFSSLDFNESFLQVKLDEESRKYTAFCFEGTPYEFTVLPFGTKDSMQGFLAAARRALEGTEEFVAAYVDDILVYSKMEEEHKQHLKIVFKKLEKAGMTLKLKKCKFFKDEVPFLGYIINREGIKPNPDKVKAIQEFPTPVKTRDVQSFMGMANYYRNHIPNFAGIGQALHKLCGNMPFKWEDEQKHAFEKLKHEMSRCLLEAHPRFDRTFYIMSDASQYGVGGFVYQMDDQKQPKIINMVSRTLNMAESRYTTYERELLGLIYTLKKCRYFLDGHPIVCYTDHQALTMLRNDKERAATRIIRWLILLEEFNIEAINYIEGDQNQLADTLSRYFKDHVNPDSDYVIPMSSIKAPELIEVTCNDIVPKPTKITKIFPPSRKNFTKWLKMLEKVQQEDNEIKLAYEFEKNENIIQRDGLYHIKNRNKQYHILVPQRLREGLIDFYHKENMHPGVRKLVNIVQRYFNWPGCESDIKEYTEECEICKISKRQNKKLVGQMFNITANAKNELLSIDLYGPLPKGRGGVEKILVILDVYTKFVKLFAIKRGDTKTCLRKLDQYILEFGTPKNILSDNGTNFTSTAWIEHWKKREVQLRYTSVYRPASNPVERVMQTISEVIRMNVQDNTHGKWPELLDTIEQKINCVEHTTTGVPPITSQLHKKPGPVGHSKLIPLSQEEIKQYEEKARNTRTIKIEQRIKQFNKDNKSVKMLQPGDLVYIKTHPLSDKTKNFAKKFAKLFKGPYTIVSHKGNNSYTLENLCDGSREDHHINNLRY